MFDPAVIRATVDVLEQLASTTPALEFAIGTGRIAVPITNLTTQHEQVSCFQNAARHLAPGGHFVVETFVPRLRALPPEQRFVTYDVNEDFIGIDEYDIAHQRLTCHYVQTRQELERSSMPFRYVWPSELDLMAQLAGLEKRERWADWQGAPITGESASHVSVWQKSP